MNSGPVIEYLSRENKVIVADQSRKNLNKVINKIESPGNSKSNNIITFKAGFENNQFFNYDKPDCTLDYLINTSDVIISLLPATMHYSIAEKSIEHRKNMITASYVTPEMKSLDNLAKGKGVLIVNECGLDPGIDHMSAMRIFEKIDYYGGVVKSFESYCGGLPSNKENNPFSYQFSWRPEGVLKAAKSPARFLKGGKVEEIEAGKLFLSDFNVYIPGQGVLEGYYNRDSLKYIDAYNLEGVDTFIRGTLRYPNWCETLQAIYKLGLLSENKKEIGGMRYSTLIGELNCLDNFIDPKDNNDPKDIRKLAAEYLKIDCYSEPLKKLDWLGIFSEEKISESADSPLSALIELMKKKMSYEDSQTDMIVMQHEIIVEYDNNKKEKFTSTLVYHGDVNGYTAMAKTVGLPIAYATELVLDGKLNRTGIIIPTTPDIYNPILDKLDQDGIRFQERIEKIHEGYK